MARGSLRSLGSLPKPRTRCPNPRIGPWRPVAARLGPARRNALHLCHRNHLVRPRPCRFVIGQTGGHTRAAGWWTSVGRGGPGPLGGPQRAAGRRDLALGHSPRSRPPPCPRPAWHGPAAARRWLWSYGPSRIDTGDTAAGARRTTLPPLPFRSERPSRGSWRPLCSGTDYTSSPLRRARRRIIRRTIATSPFVRPRIERRCHLEKTVAREQGISVRRRGQKGQERKCRATSFA